MPLPLFCNRLFGPFVAGIMRAVHVEPYDPLHPITNAFSMEIAVFGVLLLFFILVRATLTVEKPGSIQQIAEMIHGFVSDQADSVIGHGSQRYVVFVTCLGIFILLCNLIGLIPGLVTPTAKATVPLGLAVLTFAYYHYQGIRENGVLGHAKHFLGPIWWISWFMVLIEIISHWPAFFRSPRVFTPTCLPARWSRWSPSRSCPPSFPWYFWGCTSASR